MHHLSGLIGLAAIFLFAWAISTDRRRIRYSIVLRAFLLQFSIAIFVLYVPVGREMIAGLSSGVVSILDYARVGINMVFGGAVANLPSISFAFQVLPIIVFFSSLMAVLYHLKIMQKVVRLIGGALQRIIGTAPVESLNAATTILVGQSEAPLVIKPYIPGLTAPQLFAVMVSGFASVAGTLLAAYAQMGIRLDYLLAASFMAAPGGLLMAKIIMPDAPEDVGNGATSADLRAIDRMPSEHVNVIMAAAAGAQDGVKVAVNVAAMLLAFVALIAMVNGIIGGIGGWFGYPSLSMQLILGTIFAPVMYLLDIPWSEARVAGGLFGEKLILNEFIAYFHLGQVAGELSARTQAIVTFSLCGFANFASIAIQMGCLGILAPSRRAEVARFGLRGVAAGSLSNLMSAAMAGIILNF
ncbi:NupC/NupG family nucleoside CNT transporter [Sphingopyxis sp. SE2]|uniref:NupC/NupG family nucleoside CNT transporter n=1 Tax=Sphingopyxis sp. SE2 TaxID=1586240 RepID=UPI0028C18285|nr:nucleoside transporter C-terminal domain-containing protein [Sphingopyxis sp. SE2]MDT7531614.1 NupC/NupG family nucleoside CNT transporter [Sphingopyxis sp. SE2]